MEEQDYVKRTLNAYNQDPQKFETATKDMTPFPEMEAFIKLLPTPTEPVVDAGCAFGRDTVEISNRCDNEVIGIDMAIKFLERARALYPKLSFEKMDVRKLEFESNSIAGIWSHATLLHLKDEDVQTALSEFGRVLVSQGALFVSFKEGKGKRRSLKSLVVTALDSTDTKRRAALKIC